MLSALISFLGGSVFRMILGEVGSMLTNHFERRREVEMMRLQGELDAAQHARNLEAIELQHKLGVDVIRVQGETDVARLEAGAWAASVAEGMKPIGIWWVDSWNASIRPAAATLCLWLWLSALYTQQWKMEGRDWELVCAVIGWFFADRTMRKSGK